MIRFNFNMQLNCCCELEGWAHLKSKGKIPNKVM